MYVTSTLQTATSLSTRGSQAPHSIPNPGSESAYATSTPAFGPRVVLGMSAGTRVRDAKQAAPPRGVPR